MKSGWLLSYKVRKVSKELKMSTNKKRQHYVFKAYLKPWATDKKIWCKQNGDFFNTNLDNIAVENYFYKLQGISEDQVKVVMELFSAPNDSNLQRIYQKWMSRYMFIIWVGKQIEQADNSMKEFEDYNKIIINWEEELQSRIENIGIRYLKKIKDGDITFYKNDDGNSEFNFFLATQYLRTKNMQKRIIASIEHMKVGNSSFSSFCDQLSKDDLEKLWDIIRPMKTIKMASDLSKARDICEIVLLMNDTDLNLITGDQPVINIHATGLGIGIIPEKVEFYYPITPKKAILVRELDGNSEENRIQLSKEDVKSYNNMITEQSHEQIYGLRKEDLTV